MVVQIYTKKYRKYLNSNPNQMHFVKLMIQDIRNFSKKFFNHLKWGIYHTLRIIPNMIRDYLYKRKTIIQNKNYDPDFTDIPQFIMDINPLICDTFIISDKDTNYYDIYCRISSILLYQEGFEFIQLTYLDQEHFDFI